MPKKQYYGIKYPFTSVGEEKYFFDLNGDELNDVRSKIMHVIFTPKGQRLRKPNFGTDLIKFIFSQNESMIWDELKSEIMSSVCAYVRNVSLDDIQIMTNDGDSHEVYVRIDYSVNDGNVKKSDSIITKL